MAVASNGCGKSADGVSTFYIVRGGGKRYGHRYGCQKSDQVATALCKAHGGGGVCEE